MPFLEPKIHVNAFGLLVLLRSPAAVGDIRRRIGAAAGTAGKQHVFVNGNSIFHETPAGHALGGIVGGLRRARRNSS